MRYYIKITGGTNVGPYNIYYTIKTTGSYENDTKEVPTLPNSDDELALGVTYSDLTTLPGVLIETPQEVSTIYVLNKGNVCVEQVSVTSPDDLGPMWNDPDSDLELSISEDNNLLSATWQEAYDSVGVKRYEVYVNDSLTENILADNYTDEVNKTFTVEYTNLTIGSSYSVKINAVDYNGNKGSLTEVITNTDT